LRGNDRQRGLLAILVNGFGARVAQVVATLAVPGPTYVTNRAWTF
jgi:hypothetical protein